jgi:hypothetical protein
MNRFLKHWRLTGCGEAFRADVVAYADDFVILSCGYATEALAWTKAVMTKLGLTLNEAKTSVRNARQERFDFLGYSFGPHRFKANGKLAHTNKNSEPQKSANFRFLAKRYPDLDRIGAGCERYFSDDPVVALIMLRQFGELLAQILAARSGLLTDARELQADLLRRLRVDGSYPPPVMDLPSAPKIGECRHTQSRRRPCNGAFMPEDGAPVGHLVPPHVR